MKKIILGALTLFIGSIGFAQNNTSTVNQDGNDLKSIVNQQGLNNTSVQNQVKTNANVESGMNEAYVTQKGIGNYANQWQNGKDGKIDVARINQTGNGNRAWQTQGPQAADETADATQRGNNNTSRQTQVGGARNDADVIQDSDLNEAYQYQSGIENKVFAKQNGFSNYAKQDQVDFSKKNVATVYQTGNGNDAFQKQTGAYKNSARGNAYINQTGNFNYANQDQSPSVNEQGVYSNDVIINQQGSWDDAYQKQYGLDDYANILQRGGQNNYGYQYQDVNSMSETARLTQTGSFNESWQYQYGTGNTSTVNQSGISHWSKTTQMGASNTTNVTQTN